jgi:predicted RNA-binding Zn-ribbon protein involved in translation (DUF1610 family)
MSLFNCPGSDSLRNPRPEEIACPSCGEAVEIWSDEAEARCPACGETVSRALPASCLNWCARARECIGPEKYDRLRPARPGPERKRLKDELLEAMREYFGGDEKRIRHAEAVTGYAEEILRGEPGSYPVVIAAAILHDIGIPAAEKKYGSSRHDYQEREGPPVARKIMEARGIEEAVIGEVCGIIARHHSPRERETDNFKIVYDADQIVNLAGNGAPGGGRAGGRMLTRRGRALAAPRPSALRPCPSPR